MGGDGIADGLDVVGRGAATATDQVDEAAVRELAQGRRHVIGRLVVAAEGVRQPGVGMDGDGHVRHLSQALDVGPQLRRAQGAVEADGGGPGMGQRVPERLRSLAGQGASAGVGDGARDDERQFVPLSPHGGPRRRHRGLGVQGVEDGLDQDQVNAAADQGFRSRLVGREQLRKGCVALPRIIDVRRQAGGDVSRAEHARGEPRPFFGGVGLRRLASDFRRRPVHGHSLFSQPVVGLGDFRRGEGVGLDDVRASLQIAPVGFGYQVGLGQAERIVVALDGVVMGAQPFAPIVLLAQALGLQQGAIGAVEHQDALAQQRLQ